MFGAPRCLRAHLGLSPRGRGQSGCESFSSEPVPEGKLKPVLFGGCVQTAVPPSEEQEMHQASGSVTEPLQCPSPLPRPRPLITRLRCNQGPLVHAGATSCIPPFSIHPSPSILKALEASIMKASLTTLIPSISEPLWSLQLFSEG